MINFDALKLLNAKIELWLKETVLFVPNLLAALCILVVFWTLSRFAHQASHYCFRKTKINLSLEQLIGDMIRIGVLCIGLVITLNILKLDKAVFSLLAGVGVIGLALGFAFRDLAANFISGLTISITSPFKIGDIIEIGGVQGTVSKIQLRSTTIKNFNGQDVLMPNKKFMESDVTNFSSHGMRKVVIEFGIGYSDNLEFVQELVTTSIKQMTSALETPAPATHFINFADSSINLRTQFWIKFPGEDFAVAQNQAASIIKNLSHKEKFQIPFPIRTLDFDQSFLEQKSICRTSTEQS